ncbi:MAG: ComF family protein, partial [Bacteroidia bacterium]|nr:ComF family protein [Bacteroidia bacterium]
MLHTLKYRNNPELGLLLGKVCGDKLRRTYDGVFSEIVPVPLHTSRQKSRGYNQSAMFGKGLSEKLAIPMNENLLARVIKTETQTRKSKLRRWENVDTIFRVSPGKVIAPGSHLLLVDDVVT